MRTEYATLETLESPDGNERLILGIDPGYGQMGYAVVVAAGNDLRLTVCDAIMTPAGSYPQRLKQIYDQLGVIISRYRPREAAIEKLFFGKNATTAIAVAQARGVTLLALAQSGLPYLRVYTQRGQTGRHGLWGCQERTAGSDGSPLAPITCNPSA